jgi:tetratricopeptide (TPR) repeat protein
MELGRRMARKSTINTKKISDMLILAGVSAAFSIGPVMAQGGGLSDTSPAVTDFSYDEAMKALEKTKEHSEAVQNWGERRTVEVPAGTDPQKIIETELKKVPPIDEIGVVKPNSAPAAKTSTGTQEQGWDWLKQEQNKSQGATSTTTTTKVETKNDDSIGLTDIDVNQTEATKKVVEPAPVETPTTQTQTTQTQTTQVETPAAPAATATTTTTSTASTTKTTEAVPGQVPGINFYNDAVKAHLANKLDEAIAKYKQAVEANPNLGQAHCNLGLIFNQQHKFAEALVEFQKALAIDPKDAITYNGIGAALRAQKDLDGAIKNWQTAVTYNPHLATAHYNLGTAYELKKDYDKALESYRQATANDYRLGEAYFRMGIIMQGRNQQSEAKEQFSQALKVSPSAEYSKKAREFLAAMEQSKTK